MAFERPGGEGGTASGGRPIDLAHLSRQTLGDRALEQEVLAMFAHQISGVDARMREAATDDERHRLAHKIKGAARGVGAFALADCAEEIERNPADKNPDRRLAALVGEVQDFIAAISR